MKAPCLPGGPSMPCRIFTAQVLRTTRRTHRSAVCARSARAGQLRKLRRTQALLRTNTHTGAFTLEGAPAASRRAFSRPPPEWKWLLIRKICQTFQHIPHLFFFGSNPLRLRSMRIVGTSGATSQRPVGTRTRGFVCVKAREEIFHT
jgi:hypothetical protein